MDSSSTQDRRQFWDQHVTQFQNSDLNKAQYCREHQLTYHLFIYYCAQRQTEKDESVAHQPSGFVPVRFGAPVQPSELDITLPNGVQINGITEHTSALAIKLIAQL